MKTVLLVEDNRIQRLANERVLARADYKVFTAKDGEEALQLAQEKVPDIILLDMLLPRLGGREVLRSLKANPSTAQIPVLVLSALSQANEEKLRAEGAADYFEKSRLVEHKTGEKELLAVVKALLDRASRRQEADSRNPAPAEPGSP